MTQAITERQALIATADGRMPAFIAFPSDVPAAPAVILFHDAPGIREELHDMARRIARAGYFCVLPDLYYRLGHIRLDLTRRTEAHASLYRAMAASLSNSMVAKDTASTLEFTGMQTEAHEGAISCIGFSIGGRFALQAAGLFAERVGAAITVCGTELVTEAVDSPHLSLKHGAAELLFEFAEHDPAVPAQVIPALEQTLHGTGHRYTVAIEPDTQHGYHFPLRPMYRAAAAESSWHRIFDVLQRSNRMTS